MTLANNISIETLEDFPVFSEFSAAELQEILGYFHDKKLPADTLIMQEDEDIAVIYFLFDGEIELYQEGKTQAKKLSLAYLHHGDLIGEVSYFDGGSCSASAISRTPVTLGVLTYLKLREMAIHHPSIYYKLIEKLAHQTSVRIRKTNKQLHKYMEKELMYKDRAIARANFITYMMFAILCSALLLNFFFYIRHKLG